MLFRSRNASVTMVVLALVAGQALETWIGWRLVRKSLSPGVPCRWVSSDLQQMLFAGVPIGVAAVLQALNLRLDVLTLSPFASSRVLGCYQAAAWFPVGAFLFVSLMMTTLYPKLSRLLRGPESQGNAYVASLLKGGVLFMTAVSIIAGLLAPYLLRLLFGPELIAAFPTLRILLVALPFIFINTALFYVFIAAQKRTACLSALLTGVITGSALSLVLSAKYGPTGTAVGYVLREACMAAVYLSFLKTGDLVKSALSTLRILVCCSAGLLVLVFLLADSAIFAAAWSVALAAGIIVFVRGSQLQGMRLLMDDSL